MDVVYQPAWKISLGIQNEEILSKGQRDAGMGHMVLMNTILQIWNTGVNR